MSDYRKPSMKLKNISKTENSRRILATKTIHLIMRLLSTFQKVRIGSEITKASKKMKLK